MQLRLCANFTENKSLHTQPTVADAPTGRCKTKPFVTGRSTHGLHQDFRHTTALRWNRDANITILRPRIAFSPRLAKSEGRSARQRRCRHGPTRDQRPRQRHPKLDWSVRTSSRPPVCVDPRRPRSLRHQRRCASLNSASLQIGLSAARPAASIASKLDSKYATTSAMNHQRPVNRSYFHRVVRFAGKNLSQE